MPTVKAGTTFREITRKVDGSKILKEYESNNEVSILVSEINDFDEWFEEVKEPTDSIHWKPQPGDRYWFVDYWGTVICTKCSNTIADAYNFDSGNTYRTEEECKKARNRKLAEVRLRRTSTFKPDFKNGKGGYSVGYDYIAESLRIYPASWVDAGEPVRYETEEDAQKSIDEHEKEWLAYFGIKKGEQEECR